MINKPILLFVLITYMFITYYLVGWKYENYRRFKPFIQHISDLLHIIIVSTNILFFLYFSYILSNGDSWNFIQFAGIFIFFAGIMIILSSIWFLGASTFFQRKGTSLIRQGPYKYVRHPIYSGGIAGAIGLCLITDSVLLFVYALFIIIMLNYIAKKEEKELKQRFKKQYKNYMEKTGMFLPKLNIYLK